MEEKIVLKKSNNKFKRLEESLKECVSKYPNFPAMQIWENKNHKVITYSEFYQAVIESTNHIKAIGIQPGDRVILLGKSRSIEWAIAFFSIIMAEATAAILDESLGISDLQQLANYCDAKAIVTSQQFFDVAKHQDSMPVLNIEDSLQLFSHSIAKFTKDSVPLDNDSTIACLIFTSGTTLHQKAVLLTHENILHVASQCVSFSQTREHDQVLGILPMNHSFGLCVMIMTLFAGGTLTFVDKLTGESILNAMQLSHTSVIPGTPRLLEAFYNNILQGVKSKGKFTQIFFLILTRFCGFIRKIGLGNPGLRMFKSIHDKFGGNLTRVISGAAPLSVKIINQLEQLGWYVIEGYGLTETGGAISCNKVNSRRAGTVGFVIDESKLKISHPNMKGEGEICFKGPNLMRGYFRDPVATAHAIQDGWLHTGDLGYLDKNGRLIITGRIKDIIVTSAGKKIMPNDVEQRYFGIPGIQELAVVGIHPKNQSYEEIHAAIVINPATNLTKENIQDLLEARSHTIPSYLRIQHLHFVNDIPKTSTLKVKRVVLKSNITAQLNFNESKKNKLEQNFKDQNNSLDEITSKVIEMVSQQCSLYSNKNIFVTTESSLQFDLGIDSLSRIELTDKFKNEFQIDFPDASIFTIDKVKDLICLIKSTNTNYYDSNTSSQITSLKLRPKPFFNTIFISLFKFLSRIIWKFEVNGLENLPAQSSFIFCSNHDTNLDLLFISSCLSRRDRIKLCCFAKQEIFEHWFFKKLAYLFNAIPVNRDGDVTPALRAGVEAAKLNWNILINPEGTRTRDGSIGPFKKGAAHISLKSGVPLIPVRIIGGFDIFPPFLKLPRFFNWKQFKRYKIKINFGKPLQLNKETTETILTDKLREEVLKLGSG